MAGILGRSFPIQPHHAAPIVGAQVFPPVARGTVVDQAMQRTRLGRTVPRPHLAPPIVDQPPLTVRALGVRVKRPYAPVPLRPHLAAPNLTPAVAPLSLGTIGTRQANQRTRLGRRAAQPPHVAGATLATTEATAAGTFVSQAVARAMQRPLPLRPHVAVASFPPLTVRALGVRVNRRPTHLFRPHLAAPVVPAAAAAPVARGTFVYRALAAPFPRVPGPHLAAAVEGAAAAPPVARGLFVLQAVARAIQRPLPLRPHYAAANLAVAAPPIVNPATIVSQAVDRARLRIGRMVVAAQADPEAATVPAIVDQSTIITQAIDRARLRVGRMVAVAGADPAAAVVVAGGDPLLLQLIVSQAAQSKRFPRSPLRPHVAAPNLAGQPVARGTFVYQSARVPGLLRPHYAAPVAASTGPLVTAAKFVRATATRRPAPKLRLAAAIVDAPPVAVGTFVYQSTRAPRLLRPHLAPIVAAAPQPVARGTFVYQAQRRPLIGRVVLAPRYAAPVVDTPPVARGTFVVSQRPTRRGVAQAPVVAPATLTQPPVSPAVITSQTTQRPLRGRSTFRPHIAGPVVTPLFVAPAPRVVSQALQRPLRGRTCPEPHVAPVNLAPPPFKPAVVVSQANERSMRVRTVPRPHLAERTLTELAAGVAQFDHTHLRYRFRNHHLDNRYDSTAAIQRFANGDVDGYYDTAGVEARYRNDRLTGSK